MKVNPAKAKLRSVVTITATASPNSYIGLLAVDKSVLLLRSGNDIDVASVFEALNKFDGGSKPTPWWSWPMMEPMIARRGGRSVRIPYWNSGGDTGEIFRESGVVALTDGNYKNQVRGEASCVLS